MDILMLVNQKKIKLFNQLLDIEPSSKNFTKLYIQESKDYCF